MTRANKAAFILGILACLPCLFPKSSYCTSNSVENSERLAQINQATGASNGSTSTYQNRLDAILSTTISQERAYVASEESAARVKASALEKEEAEEALRATELSPDRYNPKKNKDNTQVADSSAAKDSKYDGTEKAYQIEKEKIQKEFDERIQKASENTSKKTASSRSGKNKSSLPASLLNNPFYVGEETDPDQKRFAARKAVIVSRLVQRGVLDESEADAAVGQATSEEDLIANLMKDCGLTYGDATEIAS